MQLGCQEAGTAHWQQPLLKSPSVKKTGILARTTASEFLGPTNAKTGPPEGMTALENSTEIPGSLRMTPDAALLPANWKIGSRKLNDCSGLSGRTRERQ